MSLLVLGARGQLARCLQRQMPQAEFWGREIRDAGDRAGLQEAIVRLRPAAIINAAAFTAVDRAEKDRAAAWALNAQAPAAVARAAASLGVPVVHVSTDYVFDGTSDQEYTEDAATRPINIYGATKLAGELAVQVLCPRHWILRTSWLFSEYGSNFVKTILRLAGRPGPAKVVADQFGRPTYAGDLARAIAALDPTSDVPPLPFGIYHATGGPVVSWHAFAEQIVCRAHAAGLLAQLATVTAISTTEFPTAATRPLCAVLKPSPMLRERLGVQFDWQAGLDAVLAALAAQVKEDAT